MVKTPTEAIVLAMEKADDMERVIIVYKLKKDNKGNSGVGWVSSLEERIQQVGLLEEGKFGIFCDSYIKE